MTKVELLALLNRGVDRAGSQAKLAEDFGVSPAYLSDVLSGRREPGPKILEPLGLVCETTKTNVYRRVAS